MGWRYRAYSEDRGAAPLKNWREQGRPGWGSGGEEGILRHCQIKALDWKLGETVESH